MKYYLGFMILLLQVPPAVTNHVLMQASSIEECRNNLSSQDIPIDSNVNIFTANSKSQLELWDIYRPNNFSQFR